MAQSDQVVQNATFPAVRADINDNLAALYSQSSGNSAPTVTVAFQPWIDTSSSPPVKKVRNGSNTAWITESILDPAGIVTAIANGGTGATTATAALAALLPSQGGNVGKSLVTDGTAATWSNVSGITNGTAVASTSGTAIDFTGIPSTAKRVTVMFNGVSTNGTSAHQVQVGSGSFSTSGYLTSCGAINASTVGQAGSTTGVVVSFGLPAVNTFSGMLVLTLLGSNQWVASGNSQYNLAAGAIFMSAGYTPALGGNLDRVRITTVGGANTFDAGSINISWES
jgi:hypothetical protein